MLHQVVDVLHAVAEAATASSYHAPRDPRVSRLAAAVSQRMAQAELEAYRSSEPSVCGLYLHFVLSLLAVVECALRLAFITLFLFTWFIAYYIVQCASCGKNKDIGLSSSYYVKALALYSGIMCGLAGNLIVPWRPALCFYARGTPLVRPLEPQQAPFSYRVAHAGVCDVCCGCGSCCGIEDSTLPLHVLLRSALVVAGGAEQPLLSSCCGENFPTLCSHGAAMQTLRQHVEYDRLAATVAFYQTHYGCGSFEELCHQEFGAAPPSSSSSSVASQQPAEATASYVHNPAGGPMALAAVISGPTDVPVVRGTYVAGGASAPVMQGQHQQL